jgi:uncharacterized protein YbjT (DUF2867 family)
LAIVSHRYFEQGLTMKILILGATGFIGTAVAHRLLLKGHRITGLGRNLAMAKQRLPQLVWVEADLRSFSQPADWQGVIDGMDAVVNCAGALQDTPRDDVSAVQHRAMQALYQAAAARPGLRIVQISAARNLAGSHTEFMETKLKADDALARSGVEHVILRPGLVLGRNAHGGSALLRALAAMPLAIPLAFPDSLVETVGLDRLADAVAQAVNGEMPSGTDNDVVDRTATLSALVIAHRQWLGLAPAPVIALPAAVAAAMSAMADIAGRLDWRSPLRSTAMIISRSGITAGPASAIDPDPLPPDMRDNPAAVQDLWFARLFLLKPLIILTLALFWVVSGIVPLFDPARAAARFGDALAPGLSMAVTLAASCADIVLGLAVLWRNLARKAMLGMLALSAAYLLGGSIIEPSLWVDPLGPLIKVLPSIVLTVVAVATLEER